MTGAPAISSGARRWWLRLTGEAAVLVALGAGAGFSLNVVRTDRLPLDLPPALLLAESGARAVFPAEAYARFREGESIFVDARDTAAFLEGHIEGALSLPLASFDELFDTFRIWTGGQPLIVYSARDQILPADELARRLIAAGETEVLILASGFEGWAAHGRPVEAGPEGLLEVEEFQ
ncbi:MAG: rhodanese-like domain-containing protein [Candidatus Eisenbacteria bacterium]